MSTLATLLALAIFAHSCADDGERDTPLETPTFDPHVARLVTLDEARSLMPFEIRLPSFVPDGTSPTPELSVLSYDDGTPYMLTAMYYEETDTPTTGTRLRMRLEQLSADILLGDYPSLEVLEVRGVLVEFVVNPRGDQPAEAVAVWNHNGVGFEAGFYWLTDGDTAAPRITEEMRADALKVIESMIR